MARFDQIFAVFLFIWQIVCFSLHRFYSFFQAINKTNSKFSFRNIDMWYCPTFYIIKHFQRLHLDQMGFEIWDRSHKCWWTTVFRWGGQTHCPVAPFHRPQGEEGACSTCFPSYWPTQLYLPSVSTQDDSLYSWLKSFILNYTGYNYLELNWLHVNRGSTKPWYYNFIETWILCMV